MATPKKGKGKLGLSKAEKKNNEKRNKMRKIIIKKLPLLRTDAAKIAARERTLNQAVTQAFAELKTSKPDKKVIEKAENLVKIEIRDIESIIPILQEIISCQAVLYGGKMAINLNFSLQEFAGSLEKDRKILKNFRQISRKKGI